MKSKILLITFIPFFTSCALIWAPNSVKKSYSGCWDGKETGIDSLIPINGYYYSNSENNYAGNTLMLFPDGKVAYSIYDYESVKKIILSKNFNEEEFGKVLFGWGKYFQNQDSLKIQYVTIPRSINDESLVFDLKFLITEQKSLILLQKKELTSNYVQYERERTNNTNFSEFVFEENGIHPKPNFSKSYWKLFKCN